VRCGSWDTLSYWWRSEVKHPLPRELGMSCHDWAAPPSGHHPTFLEAGQRCSPTCAEAIGCARCLGLARKGNREALARRIDSKNSVDILADTADTAPVSPLV